MGSETIHRLTGKPPDTTPALYKLLWLQRARAGGARARALGGRRRRLPRQSLTGEWRTTTACADPLGLLDMERRDWADELLERVGLTRERVPALVAGRASRSASCSRARRSDVGLAPGLRVVGGAGDGQSAGLGANAAQARARLPQPRHRGGRGHGQRVLRWDAAFRTLIGAVPGKYIMETLLQGGRTRSTGS